MKLLLAHITASAHCDTMDGPVITDAKLALKENNINYISKWLLPEDETELTEIFNETMKVRDNSPEARELTYKYLFENLVRIHRAGEGVSYTGIKPERTPAEEAVAADKSIAVGKLEPFHGIVIYSRNHKPQAYKLEDDGLIKQKLYKRIEILDLDGLLDV